MKSNYRCTRNDTWLFELVGDDAADEVWVSTVQVLHQLVQRFLNIKEYFMK